MFYDGDLFYHKQWFNWLTKKTDNSLTLGVHGKAIHT